MKLFSISIIVALAAQLFLTVEAENDNYFWNTLDANSGDDTVGVGPIAGILQDIEGLTQWTKKTDH